MAALTSVGETPAPAEAAGQRGMHGSRRRRLNVFRYIVFTVFGAFFLLPLLAMARFSLEGAKLGTWSVTAWRQIASYQGTGVPPLLSSIEITLELAVITCVVTLALLVPTMIWVRLRVKWLARPMEFLSLLPLTIPAIVLVVGLAPVYAWVTYFLGESSVWLCFAYVVLVLPYAYRALDAGLSAIDVKTLAEAARSLGASWFTVMWRVILPNIRTAVLLAAFLSVALVLGEFTIASLLNRDNLQVAINLLGKRNASISIAVSFAALLVAFLVLFAMSFVGNGRRVRRSKES